MKTSHAILLAFVMTLATHASAAVLFSEDFQTDLTQWGPNNSGVIVEVSGGGDALAFTQTIGGGDIFSASSFTAAGENFHISVQYLGTCGNGASCGGFLGFNNADGETWLEGSGPYPNPHPVTETGGWQTVSFDFHSASPITLKLEECSGATDGGVPGNAFFRNLVLSDSIPEPASWMLMIAGFGMVGAAARRRVAATA